MSAVIPTGLDRDSEFLYERMRQATYDALAVSAGERVLDAAAGLGADAQELAARGVRTTNAEPSRRMTDLGRLVAEQRAWDLPAAGIHTVRAWSETLPFPDRSFRAVFCKGSLDHFDDPASAIAELARVTAADGRVVLSVVNMDSLGCRLMAWRDQLGRRRRHKPGRRHYDAPADHYTRFDPGLLREQAARAFVIEEWTGVSLLWGVRPWARLLAWLPERAALRVLALADWVGRALPALSDVLVVAGRPR